MDISGRCRLNQVLCKALYTRVRRMVRKLLANVLRTKCEYLWTRLRTCAAQSANGLHTIRHEPKFVLFCVTPKRTECAWWGVLSMHRVSFARLRLAEN